MTKLIKSLFNKLLPPVVKTLEVNECIDCGGLSIENNICFACKTLREGNI